MKKLLYSKKITNKSKEFIEMINIYCSKLNKEYAQNMLQLIFKIAKGENLDPQMLIDKYITNKADEEHIDAHEYEHEDEHEDEHVDEHLTETIVENEMTETEMDGSFLDKVIIDGKDYFYQQIENGIIYNKESKPVGVYKNKSFHFN